MTLSRQMQTVSVLANKNILDSYNQKTQEYQQLKTVDMAIILYEQKNVSDVRYKDAQYIGISSCKYLDDTMRISVDDKSYDILLANTTGRLAQYYLKEVR